MAGNTRHLWNWPLWRLVILAFMLPIGLAPAAGQQGATTWNPACFLAREASFILVKQPWKVTVTNAGLQRLAITYRIFVGEAGGARKLIKSGYEVIQGGGEQIEGGSGQEILMTRTQASRYWIEVKKNTAGLMNVQSEGLAAAYSCIPDEDYGAPPGTPTP